MTGLVVAGLAAAAGLVWLRRAFLVVTVTGRSMSPTFEPGDRVLLRRGRARTGDVVVVGPGNLVIKRLAAVAGDPVPRHEVPALALVVESTVPPGKMVLLGDALESSDSRQLGYFDADRIVGRAVRRLPRR
ncbi:S26 family signal peptidase [Dactylosporangium sp. NPDC000244]|uniref:S26 family signal peptidase n=1 Tax=Dactylosporangium sp. NPDC000244 TaxID=3154365 RepID=UPI0033349C61